MILYRTHVKYKFEANSAYQPIFIYFREQLIKSSSLAIFKR